MNAPQTKAQRNAAERAAAKLLEKRRAAVVRTLARRLDLGEFEAKEISPLAACEPAAAVGVFLSVGAAERLAALLKG